MGKKGKQKKPTTTTQKASPLKTRSEAQILEHFDKEKGIEFYEKHGEIHFITPVSFAHDESSNLFSYRLNQPNLMFGLLHLNVTPENIGEVVKQHKTTYPNASSIFNEHVCFDGQTLNYEQLPIDATKHQLLKKHEWMVRLTMSGLSFTSLNVLYQHHYQLLFFLQQGANPEAPRIFSAEMRRACNQLKKREVLDFLKHYAMYPLIPHIQPEYTLEDYEQDTKITHCLENLVVQIQVSGSDLTLHQAKVSHLIHDETCTIEGLLKHADGLATTVSAYTIRPEQIKSIQQGYICLDSQEDIKLFLRLGQFIIAFATPHTPLHTASIINNDAAVKLLLSHDADPFNAPIPGMETPWDVVMRNKNPHLIQLFKACYRYFNVHKPNNYITTALAKGHLDIAKEMIIYASNLIDVEHLVSMYPVHLSAMVASKDPQKHAEWLDSTKAMSTTDAISMILGHQDCDWSQIGSMWLLQPDLMTALWAKHPLSQDNLKNYIDFTIADNNLLLIKFILVKLDMSLEYDAFKALDQSKLDQLCAEFPNQIIGHEPKSIDEPFTVVSQPLDAKKTIKEIEALSELFQSLTTTLPKAKPASLSHRPWQILMHAQHAGSLHLSALETAKQNIEDTVPDDTTLIQHLSQLEAYVEDISHLKETHDDQLHTSTPIASESQDENEVNDLFAVACQKELIQYRPKLFKYIAYSTQLVFNYFLAKVDVMVTHYKAELTTQGHDIKHIQNLIEESRSALMYFFDDLKDEEKDVLYDRLCDWAITPKKNNAEIILWLEHFHQSLIATCEINTLSTTLSTHANMHEMIACKDLSYFIKRTLHYCNHLMYLTQNISELEKQDPILLAKYLNSHQELYYMISVTINAWAYWIPLYQAEPALKKITEDGGRLLRMAHILIRGGHQTMMNHDHQCFDQLDSLKRPQLLAQLIKILPNFYHYLLQIEQQLDPNKTDATLTEASMVEHVTTPTSTPTSSARQNQNLFDNMLSMFKSFTGSLEKPKQPPSDNGTLSV
jgi:ankyrin repeat protein